MEYYSDKKTWDLHYKDWNNIISNIKDDTEQNVYRKKIIQNLINIYESNK
jgi:hypothetical protein